MCGGNDRMKPASMNRRRLLDAAHALFGTEGIRAVEFDRIADDAGVSKVTLRRHFRTKDELACAYLRDQDIRVRHELAPRDVDPVDQIMRIFEVIGAISCAPDFLGCAFVKAIVEYPNSAHPVRQAAATHRRWFRELLRDLLVAARHPQPERTADMLVLLRDGALVRGSLEAPRDAVALLRDAVVRILDDYAACDAHAG